MGLSPALSTVEPRSVFITGSTTADGQYEYLRQLNVQMVTTVNYTIHCRILPIRSMNKEGINNLVQYTHIYLVSTSKCTHYIKKS